LPLSKKIEKGGLNNFNPKQLEVEVSKIKHPLLKPLNLNFNDGISPDEMAILAVLLNPELKVIRDEKKIAAAQVLQAGLLPNPQLSLSYEIPIRGETSGAISAYGIQLDWEITSLLTRKAKISIAKTQKSLSDNPKLLGRPQNFVTTVREIIISSGAGFLVPITGDIMRMPGLPKVPAAENIDIDNDGIISGLF
jgi:hypothetical protein